MTVLRPLRGFLGIVALAAGVLLVSYMQKRFDETDLRRAVAAVEAKFPVRGCEGKIRSRFRGLVSVSCAEGKFTVDVVRGIISGDESLR